LCYDLLQGLIFSLELLRIGLYDARVLVSEAAIMVCMRILEEQSGVLVLLKRKRSAIDPSSSDHF
jgi:hypothetical protein